MEYKKEELTEIYQIVIDPLTDEDGGGYVATVPDLPGCMADGETVKEAAEQAREAILSYLSALEEQGKSFPKPMKRYADDDCSGKFQVRIPKSLHARLKGLAQSEGVSLNQLTSNLLAEASTRKVA